MYAFDYEEAFGRLVNFYYKESPGRIMPLLLLYMAQISKPNKPKLYIEEKIRTPLNWNDGPEKRYTSPILSQFTKDDAESLALTDPAGKHMLERWECNEMDHMSIVIHHPDDKVKAIRSFFQKRDEALGDDMKTRKALFSFVQGLERIPKDILSKNYLVFANMILKSANVLDEMEDFDLAMFEKSIIGKAFKGNIFVSQSKSPFLAASYNKAKIVTESAGPNAELDSYVSYLLIKGNGCKDVTCTYAEKPFKSEYEGQYDLVIMNRAAHNKLNQHSDWHDCLKSIRGHMTDKARFVGIVENKFLFAMLDKQELFTDCIAKNELEGVILLPKKYRCSLVTLNKAKRAPDTIKFVNLYNKDISFDFRFGPVYNGIYKNLIQVNSKNATTEIVQLAQNKIQRFFNYTLPQKEGYELVPLRKYLRRITPSSSFSVSNSSANNSIYVIGNESTTPYSQFRPIIGHEDTERVDTFSLFHNYYYLDECSLIINKTGALEPRIYGEFLKDRFGYVEQTVPAYITNVLAFTILKNEIYPPYIVNELIKPYVKTQLEHWTCSPYGNHSEDEILDLKIYVPVGKKVLEKEEKICAKELDMSILPNDHEIDVQSGTYTIKECLGQGGFGISYLVNRRRGFRDDLVVLKEYLTAGLSGQESQRDENYRISLTLGDLEDIRKECNAFTYLEKFIDEAELMIYFSKFPGCRIRTASDIFKYDETNTYYYVTDYYPKGTLADELEERGTIGEEEAIRRIMIPLARAIKTMHDQRWLHLDIKAANVLIDKDDCAVLGDLGIAQHYDESGKKITKGAGGLGSEGASLRQKDSEDEDYSNTYHPEQDVYSLAALYYLILTGKTNHRRFNASDLNRCKNISDESKQAIILALKNTRTLETTPTSVLDFMRMLPGCHDLELPVITPVEVVEGEEIYEDGDFDFNELEAPYFMEEDFPFDAPTY